MRTNRKILLLLFFVSFMCNAQNQDTILITSEHINTKVLKEGIHRYLVYFKMNKGATRTQTQFWTREMARIQYNGRPCIEINQSWEDKDSVFHVVRSISDAETMQPMYHQTWWKVQRRNSSTKTVSVTTVDYLTRMVDYNGKLLPNADTTKQARVIWEGYKSSEGRFHLNWHLDLEIFPLLPYEKGVTFIIPFYDPGTASAFQKVAYTVTGTAELVGYDNQKIDCWILEHEEKGNREVFWISKKTKEVLKLEQEINGSMYRYKIKLGFSI